MKEVISMNFGQAIEALISGKNVARAGWNGKGMYLFLVKGEDLSNIFDPDSCECVDSIGMKTAQDTFVIGWLASQTDMLAEDWVIVDRR